MTAKIANAPSVPDADIEEFLVEHHDDVAVKLAAARDQIGHGEALPLEPLDELLRDARTHTGRS